MAKVALSRSPPSQLWAPWLEVPAGARGAGVDPADPVRLGEGHPGHERTRPGCYGARDREGSRTGHRCPPVVHNPGQGGAGAAEPRPRRRGARPARPRAAAAGRQESVSVSRRMRASEVRPGKPMGGILCPSGSGPLTGSAGRDGPTAAGSPRPWQGRSRGTAGRNPPRSPVSTPACPCRRSWPRR